MTPATLLTFALVVSASLVVAYYLGRFAERDARERAALDGLTADVRSEWQRVIASSKRRDAVRRLNLVRGGHRARGPFA